MEFNQLALNYALNNDNGCTSINPPLPAFTPFTLAVEDAVQSNQKLVYTGDVSNLDFLVGGTYLLTLLKQLRVINITGNLCGTFNNSNLNLDQLIINGTIESSFNQTLLVARETVLNIPTNVKLALSDSFSESTLKGESFHVGYLVQAKNFVNLPLPQIARSFQTIQVDICEFYLLSSIGRSFNTVTGSIKHLEIQGSISGSFNTVNLNSSEFCGSKLDIQADIDSSFTTCKLNFDQYNLEITGYSGDNFIDTILDGNTGTIQNSNGGTTNFDGIDPNATFGLYSEFNFNQLVFGGSWYYLLNQAKINSRNFKVDITTLSYVLYQTIIRACSIELTILLQPSNNITRVQTLNNAQIFGENILMIFYNSVNFLINSIISADNLKIVNTTNGAGQDPTASDSQAENAAWTVQNLRLEGYFNGAFSGAILKAEEIWLNGFAMSAFTDANIQSIKVFLKGPIDNSFGNSIIKVGIFAAEGNFSPTDPVTMFVKTFNVTGYYPTAPVYFYGLHILGLNFPLQEIPLTSPPPGGNVENVTILFEGLIDPRCLKLIDINPQLLPYIPEQYQNLICQH